MEEKMQQVKECLDEIGIDYEVRKDRPAPYINIGDVKQVKHRIQFWFHKDGTTVEMFVGKDMGIWYIASSELPYLDKKYLKRFKENKVVFPSVEPVLDFIHSMTH